MSGDQNQYLVHRDGRGRFLLQSLETGIIHGLAFPGFPGESAHAFSRDYGSVSYPEEIQNRGEFPELAEMPFFTIEGMSDLSSYFNDSQCQDIYPLLGPLARQNGTYHYPSPQNPPPPSGSTVNLEAGSLLWRYQVVNPRGSWNLPILGSAVNDQGIWLGFWDGQVLVIDHQGDEIQRYSLTKPARCLTIVTEDPWVSCEDGNLYELTAKLPQPIYAVRPEGDQHYHYFIWAMQACGDGLLVADAYGNLWRLRSDLSLGWHYHDPLCWHGCWLGVDATQVYWGYYRGVIAFDLETGQERWRCALEAPVLCGGMLDHEIVVGCSDRSLYGLSKTPDLKTANLKTADLKTCKPTVRKVYTGSGLPYTIAVAPDQSTLFVGDFRGYVEQLAVHTQGNYVCKTRLFLNAGSVTRLEIWHDRLYVGTNQGTLLALPRGGDSDDS